MYAYSHKLNNTLSESVVFFFTSVKEKRKGKNVCRARWGNRLEKKKNIERKKKKMRERENIDTAAMIQSRVNNTQLSLWLVCR
jgi:hypothetical protein